MRKAQAVLDEYDEARAKNVDEWNTFAEELQQKIQNHNARLAELSQADAALKTE